MINKIKSVDKKQFIHQLFSAVSIIDNGGSHSSVCDVATKTSIDELVETLIQQQFLNTENDPIFPSISILLKQELLERKLVLSEAFFELVKFIDSLFSNLLTDEHLKKPIKNLISQIRVPFFKLVVSDHSLLSDSSHPSRVLLNDMVEVGFLWTTRDPKTHTIKEQIETVVRQIITASKTQRITTVFDDAQAQFKHFSSGLIKRVEIFEKRLRETEEGHAKAELTKSYAKELLNKVAGKKNIPFFVLNIFNKAWERVIFLELLKENKQHENEAFRTAKQLLVSLQPISNEQELKNHQSLRPQLIDQLKRGLLKAAYPYKDSDKFFEQLNVHYEAIIAEYKRTEEKRASQDIIRLKPIGASGSVSNNSFKHQAVHSSNDDESLEQWIDRVFEALPIESPKLAGLNDVATKTKTSTSLETLSNLQLSPWFELMTEAQTIRVKFSSYIQQIDKYIFVDGAGTKKAEFSSSELNKLFNENQLVAIDSSPAFDRAYRLVTESWVTSFLKAERVKLEAEQRLAKEQEAQRKKALEFAKVKQKLAQAELKVKEAKESRDRVVISDKNKVDSQANKTLIKADMLTEQEYNDIVGNLSNLAIGTRVEIEISGQFKLCQLAAKIGATGKYIFTDRTGNKVLQCVEKELVEMFRVGRLGFKQKSDIFVEGLTTVITSIRSLKSDRRIGV
ncbi:DUF1631 domain-containing protein [Aliikangiella marina]|uniref:DUF1631 domain-containing protein n=1 Tax=Aliikangiella marina TaxID=1712262 RepID=A0A545T2M9_9GAMM|nr:DUF1631 family protein [Aliikangiella marina]TQV71466.1 DUF1631 domain-containing protein [Aliikangiella marina]